MSLYAVTAYAATHGGQRSFRVEAPDMTTASQLAAKEAPQASTLTIRELGKQATTRGDSRERT